MKLLEAIGTSRRMHRSSSPHRCTFLASFIKRKFTEAAAADAGSEPCIDSRTLGTLGCIFKIGSDRKKIKFFVTKRAVVCELLLLMMMMSARI